MADIVKANIGNALHSVAPDHVVAVSNDVYDEELQNYQSNINRETESRVVEAEGLFSKAKELSDEARIMSVDAAENTRVSRESANIASKKLTEIKAQIQEMEDHDDTHAALVAKLAGNIADTKQNIEDINESKVKLSLLIDNKEAYLKREKKEGIILGFNNAWDLEQNKHLIIPVAKGSEYTITGNAGENSYIAFLKTYNIAQNVTPDYCNGYEERVTIARNTPVTGAIPNDCNWMYVQMTIGEGRDIAPKALLINGLDGEQTSVRTMADAAVSAIGDMVNSKGEVDGEYIYKILGAGGEVLFAIKPDGVPVFQKRVDNFERDVRDVLLEEGIVSSDENYQLSLTDQDKIVQFDSNKGCKVVLNNDAYNKYLVVSNQQEFNDIPNFVAENKGSNILITIKEGDYVYTDNFIKIDNNDYTETKISIIGEGNVRFIGGSRVTINDEGIERNLDNYAVPYAGHYSGQVVFFDGKELVNVADTENMSDAGYETITSVESESGLYKITDKLGLPNMTEEECIDIYIYIRSSYYIFTSQLKKVENGIIYFKPSATEEYNETHQRTPFLSGGSVRYKLVNIKDVDNSKPYIYKNKAYIPYRYKDMYILDKGSFFRICGRAGQIMKIKELDINNITFVGGKMVILGAWSDGIINIEGCTFIGCDGCVHGYKSGTIRVANCKGDNILRYLVHQYHAKGNMNILNNYVDVAGTQFYSYAIEVTGDRGWIARNTLVDCYMGGIRTGLNENYDTYGSDAIIIEYNEIYMTDKAKKNTYNRGYEDMGAIYSIGYNYKAIIRHNYIHDMVGSEFSAPLSGIFLDNGCSNTAVYKNLIVGNFTWSINSYLSVANPTWHQHDRYIANNVVTARMLLETVYGEKTNGNGSNIVCYERKKPKNTYTRVSENDFYYAGCKVDNGRLLVSRETAAAIKSARLSNYVNSKIGKLYE